MSGQLKLEDLQSFDSLFGGEQAKTPVVEKRRSDRKAFAVPGQLRSEGVSLEITTLDISAGGLSVCVPAQIGVGTEVQFSLAVPPSFGLLALAGRARVVYCFHTGGNLFKAGLEFLQLSSSAEDFKRWLDA